MNETAILQQVKQYIDALLQGADPVSGEALPADSALRRETLVQCFQSISQELQTELDGQEEPLSLIGTMTLITRPLGYTGCRGYLSNAAELWLIREGYLTAEQDAQGLPDPKTRALTPKGRAAGGLLMEPREDGYIAIRCTRSAQALLQDNLEQIMEVERTQWEPLLRCLTPEWHVRAALSASPLKVMEMLRQLHGLLPPDLPRRINLQQLSSWMVRKGLMEEVFLGRDFTRRPTWEGQQLGISSGKSSAAWSPEAQQFILDNLEAMAQDMASGDAYRLGCFPEQLTGVREALAGVEYAPEGENIFRLEDRAIKLLADTNPGSYKLPRGLVLAWLRREGYYTVQAVSGGAKPGRQVPTDRGLAAGISLDERGYLRFNGDAQRLVLEHLEDIWDLFLEVKGQSPEQ